jgi:hypothetical protein
VKKRKNIFMLINKFYMKLLQFLLLVFAFQSFSFGQGPDISKMDNNPKLTIEESAWLNRNVNAGDFNFNGKFVGFTELLSGGFYGIGKFTLRLTKREFFKINPENSIYTLYVLNAAEKKQTKGYDAVLVRANKTIKGKMRRLKRASVIAEMLNRFPQIPASAGVDSNPVLSEPNAEFFNEIYKYDINYKTPIDFTGKKVAIFDTHCNINKIEQKSIAEYIERVKGQLDNLGFYPVETTDILTEQQKKESGGYDIIIQYYCKMDNTPISFLINELKKSGK